MRATVRSVTSCSLADIWGRSRGTCCLLLYHDDKSNKFLLNVLSVYTASHSRRQLSLAAGRNSNVQVLWIINLRSQVRLWTGGLPLGLLGECQVVCGCSWRSNFYVCSYYSQFLYMCVYLYIYMRMYNEHVFIVPSSALNLSVCKCNLPVCRYECAARISMSYYPSGTAAGHKAVMLKISSQTFSKM